MAIKIKDENVLESILSHEFDYTLILILLWLYKNLHLVGEDSNITITEGYRKQLHEGDVHALPVPRGIDLRSIEFKNPQRVCDYINNNWEYDHTRPEKKVCILHDTGKGIHFHIQSHPNTKMRVKNTAL